MHFEVYFNFKFTLNSENSTRYPIVILIATQTVLEVSQRQVAGPPLYSWGAESSAKDTNAMANRRAASRLSNYWVGGTKLAPRRTESRAGFVN